MKKIICAVSTAVLFGCSNPYNHPLPDGETEDPKFIEVLSKLDESEREDVVAFLLRREFSKAFNDDEPTAEARTVREALDRQKEWKEQERVRKEAEAAEQRRQEMLAEQMRKEREEKARTMREAVSVVVLELSFAPSNYRVGRYRDEQRIVVALENNTDRHVRGVKGSFRFADIFGDEIKTVGLTYDEGIPPKERKEWRGTIRHNEFDSSDVKLANTEMSNLKISWEPEVILYDEADSEDDQARARPTD